MGYVATMCYGFNHEAICHVQSEEESKMVFKSINS